MMNTPLLPGMQASQIGENVVRGRNQGCCGCGNNPMSPSRAEAGCAGVSNNVPIPPSTPSSRGNQDGPNLGGVIPNAGGGFGPQQNVWGGFVPRKCWELSW